MKINRLFIIILLGFAVLFIPVFAQGRAADVRAEGSSTGVTQLPPKYDGLDAVEALGAQNMPEIYPYTPYETKTWVFDLFLALGVIIFVVTTAGAVLAALNYKGVFKKKKAAKEKG